MLKLLGELILKLILSHFIKTDKSNNTLRTVSLVGVILIAMGLLQYSDAMLNVHKAKSINDINRPALILEQKLESCQMLLENYKGDLEYCRARKCAP